VSVIVVDIDGVLADFNTAALNLLRSQGVAVTPWESADPAEWAWWQAAGATPADVATLWTYIEANPLWWSGLGRHRDFTDAAESILYDLVVKHEVYFVTSRPKGARRATQAWLEFWLNEWAKPQVILTPTNKVAALIGMEPDIVIEDKRETLMDVRCVTDKGTLILIDRAYNQGFDDGLVRVPSTLVALQHAKEIL
jgi:uncharacterized HAD superfamily protein